MSNNVRAIPPWLPLQVMMLSDIVHRFKSLTTAKYRYGVQQLRWKSFPGKLWQRNYSTSRSHEVQLES